MTELEKKVQFNQMYINPHNPSSQNHLYFLLIKVDESVIVCSFFNPSSTNWLRIFIGRNQPTILKAQPNRVNSVQFPTRIYIKVTCRSRFYLSCPSQRYNKIQNPQNTHTHTK